MTSQPTERPTALRPLAKLIERPGSIEPLGRRDVLWLVGLMLLTLLPRLVVTARLGSICDDGYFYLAVAEAYDRGDLHTALWYLNVNIYPVLIYWFQSLGLDPLGAAQGWGIAAATLTVLPLFGWLRRLLNRPIALAACAIYAVHPEFIEISSEPIRDSTFWLLSAASLYFLWRAAAERRLWLFAAAGLSVALAAHTRTEGWLLALPAVAWPLVHWRRAHRARWRLAVGTAITFAMIPLFVVAFNISVLRNHAEWEWGKLEHFRLAAYWMSGTTVPETSPQVSAAQAASIGEQSGEVAATSPSTSPNREPVSSLLKDVEVKTSEGASGYGSYFDAAAHSLEPIPLLLMLVGAIFGHRLLLRPENLVLSGICLAVFLGVWVRLSTLGEINGRYFLFCFFPAAGSAGLGLLCLLSAVERASSSFKLSPVGSIAVTGLAILLGGAHIAEAVTGHHPSREREAAIGQLLRERLGPGRALLVLPPACRVGYYAAGRLPVVALDDTPIELLLDRHAAEVVILEHDYTPKERCADLAARLMAMGWRPYELPALPESQRFVVLTRPKLANVHETVRSRTRDIR